MVILFYLLKKIIFESNNLPEGRMVPEVLAEPDWWEEELAVWHLDEVVEDAEAESEIL